MSAEIHNDDRWGKYYNIGKDIVTLRDLKYRYYTVEIWLKLTYYPSISSTNKLHRPVFMRVNDQLCKFSDKHIYVGRSWNKFPHGEWFQLVISSGDNSQLGAQPGRLYINGKSVDKSLDTPDVLNGLSIGNMVPKKHKSLSNPLYVDNMMGLMRIYNRSLDPIEIENNYTASAPIYGLIMDTYSSYVKHGLKHILPKPSKPSIQCTKKSIVKKEKNISENIMNNAELQKLSKLFAQIHNDIKHVSAPKPKKKVTCKNITAESPQGALKKMKNINADIVMLNGNPDTFVRMLRGQEQPDRATQQMMKVEASHSEPENVYSSILNNPFKAKLFVTYLKQNPKNFVKILDSNQLNLDQLAQLNNYLQAGAGAREGFVNYSADYEHALDMLNEYLHQMPRQIPQRQQHAPVQIQVSDMDSMPPMQRPSIKEMQRPSMKEMQRPSQPSMDLSGLSGLSDSARQIANVMTENHREKLAVRKHRRRMRLMHKLKNMNEGISDAKKRVFKLQRLLAIQNKVLGLIINKQNGKCVGAIKSNGAIKPVKKTKKSQNGPMKIIMNSRNYQVNLANILKQHQMHNLSIRELVEQSKNDKHTILIGQCINRSGKTIAVIVRYGQENHYIPTVESEPHPNLPVLAVIDVNQQEAKVQQEQAQAQAQEQMNCSSGKCLPGYDIVENEVKGADDAWIEESDEESEESEEEA